MDTLTRFRQPESIDALLKTIEEAQTFSYGSRSADAYGNDRVDQLDGDQPSTSSRRRRGKQKPS
eukprot:5904432-Prorocentrum_lima.AAC.1